MTNFARRTVLPGLLLCILGGTLFAQRNYFRQRRGFDMQDPRTAQSERTPEWKYEPGFEKDVFTFVRIIYSTGGRGRRGFGWGGSGRGMADRADAELNLAWGLENVALLH